MKRVQLLAILASSLLTACGVSKLSGQCSTDTDCKAGSKCDLSHRPLRSSRHICVI